MATQDEMARVERIDQAGRILRFVNDVALRTGVPPTVREIAKALDLPRSTVQHRLDWLQAEGWLTKKAGYARTARPADGVLFEDDNGQQKTD